jgi:hypothetical protein
MQNAKQAMQNAEWTDGSGVLQFALFILHFAFRTL